MSPPLLLLLSASFACAADDAAYQKYLQSRERVEVLQQAVQRYEEILLKTKDPSERLRIQRALEASMQAMDGADRALDAARRTMKPGDKIWEEETRVNGTQEPGLDPRVHQHSWVGEVGKPPKGPPAPKAPSGPGGGDPSDAFVSEDGSQKNVFYNPPAGRSGPSDTGFAGGGGVRYSQPAGMGNTAGPRSAEGRERHVRLRPPATGQYAPDLDAVPEEGRPLVSDRQAAREGKDAEAWRGGVDFIKEAEPFELPSLESRTLLNEIRRRAWLREADDSLAGPAERLAAMEPGSAQAHLLKALLYNRMGRFAEAEDSARTAIKLDPNWSAPYRTLAWAQLNQGKYAESVATAEKVLAMDPADPAAYALRAYARERLSDARGALQDMQRAAALQPRYKAAVQRGLRGQPLLYLPVAAVRSQAAAPETALPKTLKVGLVFLAGAALLLGAAWLNRQRRARGGS